ncbi:MAG: DUF4428 domain-containing protein [Erysipelotrichia bacterium]|nr:DUF4428 domain-containing protein [Erysipelotrichia bacterium]
MGLFDKKYCDICGNQIKFLGNRKVEDGNICKDCAKKLSPFFSDRKRSTVAEIKQQLEYRQQNQINLQSFNPDKVIGRNWKVYIDSRKGNFVVSYANDFRKENADIIDIQSVNSFEANVTESKSEIYCEDQDGENVSYVPPRYNYSYRFYVKITLSNPYFDEINFELTSEKPDSCTSPLFMEYEKIVNDLSLALTGNDYYLNKSMFEAPDAYLSNNMSYYNNNRVNNYQSNNTFQRNQNVTQNGGWTCPQCGNVNNGNFCSTCGATKPTQIGGKFCPNCGEKIDSSVKFCPQCGKQLY